LVGAPNCAHSLRSFAGLLRALVLQLAYEDTSRLSIGASHSTRIDANRARQTLHGEAALWRGALPRVDVERGRARTVDGEEYQWGVGWGSSEASFKVSAWRRPANERSE